MKKIILGLLFVSIFALVVFFARSRINTQSQNSKYTVTTSFYPMYFFAKSIGGDKANVVNITPAAAEPHDYEPTPQDIIQIENSKMLVLNGAVEGWGPKTINNLKGTDTIVITAGGSLLNKNLIEDGQKIQDPHVWLSPIFAQKEALKILEGFIKIDPANASYYQANEKDLEKKLADLNSQYKNGLKYCQEKDIVTSHVAFAYLADAYNLHQVAIAGISPDSEPSAKELANLSNFVKTNHIKYIFFETLVSPKLAETIANETGAKTLELNPLEGLTNDELQKGEDYFTKMTANLKNLQIALNCK